MNWLAFVLMLPHLKPKCIKYFYPQLYRGIDVLRVISLLVVVALFIRAFMKEKKLPALPTWILGVLQVWLCLVTLINKGDYVQVFSLAVSVMGIALLVDLYADRMKELLAALVLNFEWLTYVNLYTVLKYPDVGMTQDPDYGDVQIYFFGPDNWFMYLCIPAICVAMLYLYTQWKSGNGARKAIGFLRAVGLTAAAYACVLLQWPATAVVALAGLTAVWVIALVPGVRYCVSYPVVLVGGIGANLAIAVYRVMETVPFIADLIQNKLGKNTTLSGRTPLWDSFPQQIKGHMLTGIGTPLGGYPCDCEPYFFDHLHNVIFDFLAQGGIIALTLFFAVLIVIGIPLTRHLKTSSARIMTATMAGFLLMAIPEVCRHCAIFLIFPLAWHVPKIEEAAKRKLPEQKSKG